VAKKRSIAKAAAKAAERDRMGQTRPDKADAISGRIIPLACDRPGIAYEYPGGKHEAHPIGLDDLPIIRRLKWAGSLSYSNERLRELAAEQHEL
jgi:hypothetical protein